MKKISKDQQIKNLRTQLRQQKILVRELERCAKLSTEDYERLSQDCDYFNKGIWILHAALRFPKLGKTNSYLYTVIQTMCRQGIRLPGVRWQLLLKQTPHVVANFLDIIDPHSSVR